MIKQVRLGKTDLYVNPIGLGTNAVDIIFTPI